MQSFSFFRRGAAFVAIAGLLLPAAYGDDHQHEHGHQHSHGSHAKGSLSKRDQLRIAVQGICPMTGLKLGAHGTPVKVKFGKESLFLCCKGCLKKKVDPKHWATIHANFARAQGICPIMKKPLPGKPKWTYVNGQIVYVCCPPCAKKIAKNPESTLRLVDARYEQWLASQAKSAPSVPTQDRRP